LEALLWGHGAAPRDVKSVGGMPPRGPREREMRGEGVLAHNRIQTQNGAKGFGRMRNASTMSPRSFVQVLSFFLENDVPTII